MLLFLKKVILFTPHRNSTPFPSGSGCRVPFPNSTYAGGTTTRSLAAQHPKFQREPRKSRTPFSKREASRQTTIVRKTKEGRKLGRKTQTLTIIPAPRRVSGTFQNLWEPRRNFPQVSPLRPSRMSSHFPSARWDPDGSS
jgi:hypothetical protein